MDMFYGGRLDSLNALNSELSMNAMIVSRLM
jgi:hypothetical protein